MRQNLQEPDSALAKEFSQTVCRVKPGAIAEMGGLHPLLGHCRRVFGSLKAVSKSELIDLISRELTPRRPLLTVPVAAYMSPTQCVAVLAGYLSTMNPKVELWH